MNDAKSKSLEKLDSDLVKLYELKHDWETKLRPESNPDERVKANERLSQIQADIKRLQTDIKELSSELENQPTNPHLPNEPRYFIGRSNQVNKLVENICPDNLDEKPKSVLVFGDTGSGKTAFLLQALHDRRVKEFYGRNRFYINCFKRKTRQAVVKAIAAEVGRLYLTLNSNEEVSLIDSLRNEGKGKVLIALDDIDDSLLCDLVKVGNLLTTLAQNATLVMTLNFCDRPNLRTWGEGVKWADKIELTDFERPEAREMFEKIAAKADEKPDFTKLVEQVIDKDGASPLIVNLAARRARNSSDYDELAVEWKILQRKLKGIHRRDGTYHKIATACEFCLANPKLANDEDIFDQLISIAESDGCPTDLTTANILSDLGLTDISKNNRLYEPIRDYLRNEYKLRRMEKQTSSVVNPRCKEEKPIEKTEPDLSNQTSSLDDELVRVFLRIMNARFPEKPSDLNKSG